MLHKSPTLHKFERFIGLKSYRRNGLFFKHAILITSIRSHVLCSSKEKAWVSKISKRGNREFPNLGATVYTLNFVLRLVLTAYKNGSSLKKSCSRVLVRMVPQRLILLTIGGSDNLKILEHIWSEQREQSIPLPNVYTRCCNVPTQASRWWHSWQRRGREGCAQCLILPCKSTPWEHAASRVGAEAGPSRRGCSEHTISTQQQGFFLLRACCSLAFQLGWWLLARRPWLRNQHFYYLMFQTKSSECIFSWQ